MLRHDAKAELYEFAPLSYGDYLIWSLAAIENDEDGLGGSIALHMLCESQDPEPVLMSVVWRANPNAGRDTPFAYQLIEVHFLAG